MEQFIKPPVEVRYSEELSALENNDKARRPANWRLSPAAVRTFILGGDVDTPDGKVKIKRKFYGNDALVERAIITLAGNRGLMLVGEPGTRRSFLIFRQSRKNVLVRIWRNWTEYLAAVL